MTYIDIEKLSDIPAREQLLDRAFGANRLARTCERLREGRLPAEGLAFVARFGDQLIGTLRFWHIDAGGVPALMLGPIAVDAAFQFTGLGTKLIRHGLAQAIDIGHKGVILVGDAPYYSRFGFERQHAARLHLPGPVDDARFLAHELQPGAFAGAAGMVRATGAVPLEGLRELAGRRRAA